MKFVKLFIFASFVWLAASLSSAPTANAAVSGWKAGQIMDDSVMSAFTSMSAAEIQTFLNSKAPSCDTNGTQSAADMGRPDLTHAQYAALRGWQSPPYTCLKNYSQGGKSAARIIYDIAQTYRINPKVLIVTLQKEQSLVTDTWPLNSQYKTATGYGCPDTAACDSQYYGFTNQVTWTAKMFRAILDDSPTWYTPYVLGTNYIRYNPISGCGGTNVYITNRATQALYNYTPYQPNQAALDAGWGTGNSCSAYGNRNFYLYYTTWFGSTLDTTVQLTRSLYYSPGGEQLSTADEVAVSFIIKNTSSSAKTLDSIGVAVRDEDNNNYNYPFVNITLQPGQSYTYYQRQTFDHGGDYTMWIANLMADGSWSKDWPISSNKYIVRDREINLVDMPDVSVSRSLYYSPTSNPANASTQDITATSFKVTNNEASSVTLPDMAVQATHSDGSITYYPVEKQVSLNPGQEYEYYQYARLPKAGTYTLRVAFKAPSGRWSTDWPPSTSGSIIRERSATIISPPDVTITRHLYVSPNPILVGQQIGASFVITNNEDTQVTIKNLGVRARDSKYNTYDFPYVSDLTIDPGESYTYYEYRSFDKLDTYKFYIMGQVGTNYWTAHWPSKRELKYCYLPKI